MNVLLVEPDYYTRYPPLGLMKLAAYHRSRGNHVQLVRGTTYDVDFHPDTIEITSLFTYAWKPVHESIAFYHNMFPDSRITVGGIYASLMPEHIISEFPFVNVHKGLHEAAEKCMPAYDILKSVTKWKNWDASIIFTSRGCIRKCPFCSVPKIEGEFRHIVKNVEEHIYPGHRKVILWDNNFLASSYWKEILATLRSLGLEIDFNQGLDARLMDEEKACVLADLKMPAFRMAYDFPEEKDAVVKAVEMLHDSGVRKRKIIFYNLYNFYDTAKSTGDDPESFFSRVKEVLNLGCVSYPMRFEPMTSLKKNKFVSPLWTAGELEMVAKSRRVIGYGGVFPPYRGLLKKMNNASCFREGFELYPAKRTDSLAL
ncbi:MAG: hypothetical protein SCH66_03830 [Methanolobus sp.]|nr:hypothetical protein [Methanolobus sp.]